MRAQAGRENGGGGWVAAPSERTVVGDRDLHVELALLVIQLVLKRLLARRKLRLDALRLLGRRRGKLRLQLRLERALAVNHPASKQRE